MEGSLDDNLLAIIDIDSLGGRKTVEMTSLERVPAVGVLQLLFFHFADVNGRWSAGVLCQPVRQFGFHSCW